MEDKNVLRVGVIGLGVIGKVHTSVIRDSGNELLCVCDVDEGKLSLCPDAKGYTDYKAMLDSEKIDVLHICTPHYLHTEMVIEALKRDINVICEKPLCMKKEEIELVLEAEKSSKGQLGVCFQNRYNPSAQYVKELLKDKTVLSANGTMIWKRDEEYYAQDAWRGKKATEGGGVLINQAIHTIDMMQWIAGFPDSLIAFTENLALRGVVDVEDTATVICRGKNSFTLSASNTGRADFSTEVVFRTEDKEIRLYSDRVCINGECTEFENDAKMYSKSVYGAGHSGLIADFYDCVRSGRRFEIDGSEAAKAVKIVVSAYESFGKEIKL